MSTTTRKNSSAPNKSTGSTSRRTKQKNHTSARTPLGTHDENVPKSVRQGQLHELQAQVRRMQSELDRAHAAEQAAVAHAAAAENPAPPQPSDAPAGSIPRPNNMSNVKMEDLQQQLGFDTAQWNVLRTCVCDALSAACLDREAKWKAQPPGKLSMAYNAIEEDFPQLRRFSGQWAVHRIAQQSWSNHRSYRSCVGNESTYRGRKAAARRINHDGSASPHIPSHRRRSSHSRTPTPIAGPSHSDDLLAFSDNENGDAAASNDDDDDDREDTEDPEDPKGKKRAVPDGDEESRKRQRTH
ncbi:hypothetical protein DFH08DRAFT_1080268 [Mycena albidolilacea]|uniref:Uncharacterized protein n=1 Tax=Mycena albidolilacea TaxID=1033008 RepID=A0AAD7ERB0_9AGAR|nr:hypothetical protein DFH08DRAFT_1080266 [Mycena albidolilacea]KAJ7348175.1 hypothetical protein DFH08DRAFT_1080268 [Mycena albidolilacea]